MAITIRKVTKNDVSVLFALINELAENLKISNGPKMTIEDLHRDGGFDGGPAYYFAFLAEDSELMDSHGSPTAVGFYLGSYVYSWDGKSIFLNNILVKESHRANGVGKLLFENLLKHAKDTECNRIEFVTFKSSSVQNFYLKMGALNVTESDGYIYYRVFRDVINAAAKE